MFDQPSLSNRVYSLVSKFLSWPWARFVGSVAISFGVCLGVLGVVLGLRAGETIALASSQSQVECIQSDADEQSSITIDVSGGVKKPGVYQVAQGSRGADVIAAAGGFSSEADPDQVALVINLAHKVSDESKLYIPVASDRSLKSDQPVAMTTQLVSINFATAMELETLPGIGTKRTDDIISNRPYTTLDELISKAGLTQKQFDDILSVIEL